VAVKEWMKDGLYSEEIAKASDCVLGILDELVLGLIAYVL
jgi:hypothetical protein